MYKSELRNMREHGENLLSGTEGGDKNEQHL